MIGICWAAAPRLTKRSQLHTANTSTLQGDLPRSPHGPPAKQDHCCSSVAPHLFQSTDNQSTLPHLLLACSMAHAFHTALRFPGCRATLKTLNTALTALGLINQKASRLYPSPQTPDVSLHCNSLGKRGQQLIAGRTQGR